MLTLLYHLQILKWLGPAVFMLGSAPNFFVAHLAWRAASALLPARVYQTGDDLMYSAYQRLVLFFFESVSGVRIRLYGDVERLKKEEENIILICNHQSTVDWVVADMLAVRQGSLGHIRYVLKDGLKYLPLYGFYFRQHSGIYVRRSGKFKQDKARAQLAEIVQTNIPFWMVIFPEGTRLNEETLSKSQIFADEKDQAHPQWREPIRHAPHTNEDLEIKLMSVTLDRWSLVTGLPAYDHVLVPRQKALQLSVEELRSACHAIYDITIAYSDTTDLKTGKRINAPGLADFLYGHASELHLLVDRVDMNEVPQEEAALKDWLLDRFKQKDRRLADFYSEDPLLRGHLGKDGCIDKLNLLHTLPAFLLFAAVNVAVLGTSQGRQFYWKTTLFCTLFGWSWMTISS